AATTSLGGITKKAALELPRSKSKPEHRGSRCGEPDDEHNKRLHDLLFGLLGRRPPAHHVLLVCGTIDRYAERIECPSGAGMRIFVAHDFSRPPMRDYREPFKWIADQRKVHFVFADQVHAAEHLLEQIEKMIVEADACLFDVSTPNRNVFLE